ncbi:MAG: addiction module protein [Verrucomicrobiaceae bacterium]
MTLPEDERARLAADLLESLPVVLSDPDDGSAEGRRRIDEMKGDPSVGRSWEEIRTGLGR